MIGPRTWFALSRLRVWYWNGKDPRDETERRIAAICKHFRIAAVEIEGWLFVDSGRNLEIIIPSKRQKLGRS